MSVILRQNYVEIINFPMYSTFNGSLSLHERLRAHFQVISAHAMRHVPRARRVPSKSCSMNNSGLSENSWFVWYACLRAHAAQVAGFLHRDELSRCDRYAIESRRIASRESDIRYSDFRNNRAASFSDRWAEKKKKKKKKKKTRLEWESARTRASACLPHRDHFRWKDPEKHRAWLSLLMSFDHCGFLPRQEPRPLAWRLNPSEWKLRHDLIQVKERRGEGERKRRFTQERQITASCIHLINVPQLVNERAGVRIAGVGSRRWRHRRYREFRIVPLCGQAGIHHGLCVSEIRRKIAIIVIWNRSKKRTRKRIAAECTSREINEKLFSWEGKIFRNVNAGFRKNMYPYHIDSIIRVPHYTSIFVRGRRIHEWHRENDVDLSCSFFLAVNSIVYFRPSDHGNRPHRFRIKTSENANRNVGE